MPCSIIPSSRLKEGQRAAIVECTEQSLLDYGFVRGAALRCVRRGREGCVFLLSGRRFALQRALCEKIFVKIKDERETRK